MGIYDRDYYRGDRRRPVIGSLVDLTPVCAIWVAACIIGFMAQILTMPATGGASPVTLLLGLQPDLVMSGEVWRLLTYAFVHNSGGYWASIIINVTLLLWFASEAESIQGSLEFLAFMIGATILGGLAYVVSAYAGLYGVMPNEQFLGSSAACVTVLVYVGTMNPWRSIPLFGMLDVPIWVFLAALILKDYVYIVVQMTLAYDALGLHVASALGAFLYARNQVRLTGRPGRTARTERRLESRLSAAEPEVARPMVASEPIAEPEPMPEVVSDEHLEARLDAVLEKMAKYGHNSLSEQEKQILMQASEIYKRRRRGQTRPDLL